MSKQQLADKYFNDSMARLKAIQEEFNEILEGNKPLLDSLEKERARYLHLMDK